MKLRYYIFLCCVLSMLLFSQCDNEITSDDKKDLLVNLALLDETVVSANFMRRGVYVEVDGSIGNERTVRGLAYHIAGHELRHFNIIKERYLD